MRLALLLAVALAACSPDAPPQPEPGTVRAEAPAAEVEAPIAQAALTADLAADAALRAGDTAPSFTLPDAAGDAVSLDRMLAAGPTVLVFYRGAWCPYCNTQLRDYADRYGELQAAGASLLAVSPQAAEGTAAMRDNLGGAQVPFPVLSDVEGEVSRRYGLVFEVDEPTRERYRAVGIDLARVNGTDRWELPVPAVYLIDPSGEIRAAFVEADYSQRVSLDEVLRAVEALG